MSGFPFDLRPAFRDLPDFKPVTAAKACKDQRVVMGGGDIDIFERIPFSFHIHADNALAASALLSECVDGHPFDVVVFRDGDDHRLIRDEIFHLELPFCCDDLCFSLPFMVFFELFEFFLDDPANKSFACKNRPIMGNFLLQDLGILLQFSTLKTRELIQAKV